MRRTHLVTILVFVAGLGLGYFVRSFGIGTPKGTDMQAADRAAIEKLHKADVEATIKQDPSALASLWSDGGANFGFPGPPVVGTKAMAEAYVKMRADYPEFRVLNYSPVIQQVQIVKGWAIETGSFEATYQMSAKDKPVHVNDNGMRVLKRQNDGSWKFAVVGLK